MSVADIVKRTAKGVVEITVTSAGQASPFGGDGQSQQAQGSGFVFDKQGHIVTNQHVVDGAESVSVKFWDGSTYDADRRRQRPVHRPRGDQGRRARVGCSTRSSSATRARCEVGDGVIAIGSPFGLDQTVTTGIVSALHRQITAPNNYAIADAIQTDAAINHGNSGGPLLDLDGRVIGVNSQIESDSGGNDGVGFAIPSNTVEAIAAQLLDERQGRARLPRRRDRVDPDLGGRPTRHRDRREPSTEVRSGSPPRTRGLKAATGTKTVDGQEYPTGGDVITAVDGQAVAGADELRAAIDAKKPGQKVELTVRRDGKTTSVELTLASRPAA